MITFNSAMFDHNIVPIIHQLTDLITYDQVKMNTIMNISSTFLYSLKNGLGEYTQRYLGMGIAPCNHGLDIHNYLIEHGKRYENNTEILTYLRLEELPYIGLTVSSLATSTSVFNSANYRIEYCSSFVDYLVQTYGIDSVMKMVDGYDDNICYLFNQNGLKGLISDWKQFLSNYPCEMTWDEINAYTTEFRSTHGY